ncbi:chorismate mutase [Streptomyces sp. N2-109]|uniref:Chorismate mutase n=1 Tax=Streptomyces gossypii TaxID=2883101 RepID=A0ABT2JY02_9ACTN|nr:chorismate mutase [Streptomyces gossypii]MCT2592324.1 chorismate mutase [Streptomyces gossypii]
MSSTSTSSTSTSTSSRTGASGTDAKDGTGRGGGQETGARTGEAAEAIIGSRERIDALDARILDLVEERLSVSAHIQRARIASGGRRVNLSREMEILARYRERLGRPGTTLAMTLLELSRGRV